MHSAPESKGFDHRSSENFDYRMDSDGDDGMNHQNLGIELGYLPPDQRPGIPGELLAQLVDPEIDEDTEAAEALRGKYFKCVIVLLSTASFEFLTALCHSLSLFSQCQCQSGKSQ